jgi:hypothetical protein
MSGAKMSFTDPMPGETTPSGDDPIVPCDALSPLDFWSFANAFCASLLMAAFTTVKRIAIERPSPSLKRMQPKGDNMLAAVTAYQSIFRLD